MESDKIGLRHIVPSLFNSIATALAAAAGLIGVLFQTGYIGNHAPANTASAELARTEPQLVSSTARPVAGIAPAVSLPPPAIAPHPNAPAQTRMASVVPIKHMKINVAGAWLDGASNCHLIKQDGHELTVVSNYVVPRQFSVVGSGMVKGRNVSMRLNTANPDSPQAAFILSDDGQELTGMVKGIKGTHVARWRFVGPGPTCS